MVSQTTRTTIMITVFGSVASFIMGVAAMSGAGVVLLPIGAFVTIWLCVSVLDRHITVRHRELMEENGREVRTEQHTSSPSVDDREGGLQSD